MKRVLFVDDEPKVLDALRRLLYAMRRQWEMAFLAGGQEALAYLAQHPCDVVVTDMRMPGIDGSQLLRQVRRLYPATVRIVLSGQCDMETVLRSLGPTHQFLTKPCDSEVLKRTVARACQLRDRLADQKVQECVSQVEALPVEPETFALIRAELASGKPSLRRLGELIAADPACTLSVLQLVNTGFFGTPRRVSDPAQAVNLLGAETLRAVASLEHLFFPLEQQHPQAAVCQEIWEHTRAVAVLARKIAQAEGASPATCCDAFAAGLLHDIGLLAAVWLPADNCSASLPWVLDWTAEEQSQHTTHGDVGAYLTALRGLPDELVEAVACHHHPGRSDAAGFTALTAVHVADALVRQAGFGMQLPDDPVDESYLQRIGLDHRLGQWRQLCAELLQEVLQ